MEGYPARSRSDSVPKVRFVGFNLGGEEAAHGVDLRDQIISGSPSPVIIPSVLKDGSEGSTSPRSSGVNVGTPAEAIVESSSAVPVSQSPSFQSASPLNSTPPQAMTATTSQPLPAATSVAGSVGSTSSIVGSASTTVTNATPPESRTSGMAARARSEPLPQPDQATVWNEISAGANTEATGATPQGTGAIPQGQKPPRPSSQASQAGAGEEEKKKKGKEATPAAEKQEGQKTKAELKAERRAKQEADRARKAAAADAASAGSGGSGAEKKGGKKVDDDQISLRSTTSNVDKAQSKAGGKQSASSAQGSKKVVERSRKANELFAHLPQFDNEAHKAKILSKMTFDRSSTAPIPRIVLELCLQFLDGSVHGASERTVALLQTLQQVINEYKTPPEKTLSRDLTSRINNIIDFLINCRPMSVSMGNAIRFVKHKIANIDINLSEEQAKQDLNKYIGEFIHERLVFAHKVIIDYAVSKIQDGDVVLTHATSTVVAKMFIQAHQIGRKFKVVVVDSRPQNEGRKLLKQLLQAGLNCTYIQINALAYQMREVTKVFLGAAAVLSNGTVISRVGTAACAMVAHSFKIPVLIACETCKFSDRVQLDSFCSNELGDPLALTEVEGRPDVKDLQGCQDVENLKVLNLLYDAMPAHYITIIISEFGMIPPTSVPVILREYRKEPTL
mmetsp:Transcript_42533/g.51658  ORF Transcript_42533/g.51658 Transcript_42533/m.51658 type:complete len:676 (-) Transcript_42533:621-2648(-)